MAFLFLIPSIYLIRQIKYNPLGQQLHALFEKKKFLKPSFPLMIRRKSVSVCDFRNDILNVCENELFIAEYIGLIS